MLKPGDMIMHARHGTGIVMEIKRLTIADRETVFYWIALATGDKLLAPINADGEAALLPVARPEDIRNALSLPPQELSSDHRERALEMERKVTSGDSALVAEALRDLAWRQHSHRLSSGDIRLMEKARKALANMLVSKPQMDVRGAMKRLDEMLKQTVAAWGSAG